MVVWFIGLSGSGKTTMGRMLKEFCDSIDKKAHHIDGDDVRKFYEKDLGYSKEDRMMNLKRILLAIHALVRNDIMVIVSNISPFEEVRQFCRKKLNNYNEIYLKRSIEVCVSQDVKKMYRNNSGKSEIVGIDLVFEDPCNCDLTIETDREGPEDSFKRVLGFLGKRYPDVFKHKT